MSMKPARLLGCYGLFNSNADLDQCTDDIANSNFTGPYVFLMNPWVIKKIVPVVKNPPMHPWKFLPASGKFDLAKDNEEYYVRLELLVSLCAEKGMDLAISFDDRYCEAKWSTHFSFKPHPYRNNNAGINWGGDAKPLFNSIEFGSPIKYHWIEWTAISEPKLQWKFKLIGIIGTARERWINRVCVIVAKYLLARKPGGALKYPKFRVFWKSANEERAARIFDQATGQWKSSAVLSERDRSEPYAWMTEIWKAHGCSTNARFQPIVNRDIRASDEDDFYKANKELHSSVTRTYGQVHGMGAIHEVHLDTMEQAEQLILKSQFNVNKTMFSSDGGTPELGAAFVKKGWPMCDVLWEEAVPTNPNPAPPWEWMQNWNKAFPYHANLIK